MTLSVLMLSNFHKPFVIKIYASGTGIGDVLSQENRLIAYISQGFVLYHKKAKINL